ncbi:unnamed protein product [Peniophora sp. CBMAI 1063]|nr:unnamed protein product [Peniophora sp. CBMAI 1063]
MPRTSKQQLHAGPVTRDDDFFYDDGAGFYLKLKGDDRCYQRAAPKQLYSQITRFAGEEDESVGYYKAQLRHYGLTPKRTRPEMKKVLLAAFGKAREIGVPRELQDLQRDLERLWNFRDEGGATSTKTTPARKRKAVEGPSKAAQKKARPSGSDKKFSAQDFEGPFTLNSKAMEDKWDAAPGNLKIYLAASEGTGRHLWGSFEFGLLHGNIRGGPLPKSIGDTVTFTWRGRDREEGRMLHSWSNEGTLTFLENGKIRGTFKKAASKRELTFSGVRDEQSGSRPIKWALHVSRWKEEWRGINERADSAAKKAQHGLWSRNAG